MSLRIAVVRENVEDRELANYLPLAGEFALTVIGSTKPGPYGATGCGLPVVSLPPRLERMMPIRRGQRVIRRLVRDRLDLDLLAGLEPALDRFDIAVVNETHMASSAQACRAKDSLLGLKVITVCYENIPFRYDDNERLAHRRAIVRARSDHFIALTPEARHALLTEGVEHDRITVLPYGVNPERFAHAQRTDALRRAWGATPDDVVMLFAGRLLQEKGLVDLVQAISRCDDVERIVPVFIGSGPDEQRIRRAAASCEVTRLRTVPWMQPAELIAALGSADVFAIPSLPTPYWQEQLGFAAIEAMACGLPVLTTASGSLPFVVGDGGIAVKPYDVQCLSDALQRLVTDGSLRQRLGSMARDRVHTTLNTGHFASEFARILDVVSDRARR